MVYLFDVPIFFIILRETLESTIILSVLLGFIDKLVLLNSSDPSNQGLVRKLKRQIWAGTFAGLAVSLLLGAIFIGVFYGLSRNNLWEKSEPYWEGIFSLIASIVITFMAFSMIRAAHWKKKWEGKLREATDKYLEKHKNGQNLAMFLLPFSVVSREGLESVVFIAGVGFGKPASGLPLPVITGFLAGLLIGYIIFRGSHEVTLSAFFNTMTVFLFFFAAGLFTTSIGEFQEVSDTDDDDIVWKLNCCDPETSEGWSIANALFGWRSEATVGTTVGYFVYWGVVLAGLLYVFIRNRKTNANDAIIDAKSTNNNVDLVHNEKSEDA